jgi:Gram-negative bacterial TonB protein C-terminal
MAPLVLILLALMQTVSFVPARIAQTAESGHPPNIIQSSWALLDVEVDREGKVRSIQRLGGLDPFVEIATSSVRQWVFSPARSLAITPQNPSPAGQSPTPTDSHVTVVFLFRARELFPGQPLVLPPVRSNGDTPALPLQLSDPGYPVASLGEGQTIIELLVNDRGDIERSRVVSDVPSLGSFTEQALRSWKFQPAVREGKPTVATVVGVVSYLRPVNGGIPGIPVQPPPTSGPTPSPVTPGRGMPGIPVQPTPSTGPTPTPPATPTPTTPGGGTVNPR